MKPVADTGIPSKKEMVARLSQTDNPQVKLKIFKITSRHYIDGKHFSQKTEITRENPLAQNLEGKKVSIEDKVPAFIVEHGPTIRLDKDFMKHVFDKNDYCKK